MSLRVAGNNIVLTKGDVMYLKIVLEYANDGDTYTLEDGDTAEFAIMDFDCKEVFVQKEIDTSNMMLKLVPSDTESLSVDRVYRHGVKITKLGGDPFTVTFGIFKLLPEVVP